MPGAERRDAPDRATLAWAARVAGEAAVVRVRRLTGGIATATHLLTLSSGRQVVLRRHHPETMAEEPHLVEAEAATLAHVAAVDVPTPTLLGVDPDGRATGGRAALLMARIPGRIELAPAHQGAWLQQMAEALAVIHDAPPVPRPVSPLAEGGPWPPRQPPAWSDHPEHWQRAIELVPEAPPAGERTTLVHGDFQHYNLLWSRGRLTGVVDWSQPTTRPIDSDLGHCRLNLVILYGTAVADDFLRRYEALTGRGIDPRWDLYETLIFLPSWAGTILRQVRGRIPVDADAIHRRVDAHLPTLLARLSSSAGSTQKIVEA